MTRQTPRRWTPKNGPEVGPLEWVIGGLLDLLYLTVDRLVGRPVEALIKRLPHR